MKTLTERLHLSVRPHTEAVRIDKRRDIHIFETLCQYCAKNNIILDEISDEDFLACADTISEFGANDPSITEYYFWID